MTHRTLWPFFLLLCATLFIGIGFIAILPPFEGYDETAHFSRIMEYAAPQTEPTTEPRQRIIKTVYDYYRSGPMPYRGWISNEDMHTGDPLYQKDKDPYAQFWSYARFFNDPALTTPYTQRYRQQDLPTTYQASPQRNWQYQHPPLYYRLMAGISQLRSPTNLLDTLLFLRLLSFGIAFAGLTIGLWATHRHYHKTQPILDQHWLGFLALYPFLLPSFFGDLARLGNDTLCLFFFSIAWAFLLEHLRKPERLHLCLGIGVLLGLCLSTKMTLLPVTLSLGFFVLLFNILAPHARQRGLFTSILPPLLMGCGAILIYSVLQNLMSDPPLPMVENAALHAISPEKCTAHLSTLDCMQQNITLKKLAEGLVFLFASTTYFMNSWSVVASNLWTSFLVAMIAFGVLLAYLTSLRAQAFYKPAWLPLWIVTPLHGSLGLFMIMSMIERGDNHIPGYYIHVLAPSVALMVACGLAKIKQRSYGKIVIPLMLLWVFFVTLPIIGKHLVVFAGCHLQLGKFFSATCTEPMPITLIWERLSLIAYPMLGAISFTAGFASLAGGLVMLYLQNRRAATQPPLQLLSPE